MKFIYPLWILALAPAVMICHSAIALQAHVTAAVNGTNFVYTVSNDETTGSTAYITSFHVQARAPFRVVSTPPGWDYQTDNFTYVDWFCTNATQPYPNDIAPAASLSGFSLQADVTAADSFESVLTAWDHAGNNSASTVAVSVQGPAVLTVAPSLGSAPFSMPNGFQLQVAGVPSFSYAVLFSPDLVSWLPVFTNTSPFTLVDTNVPVLPKRFYRALFVPDEASGAVLAD